MRELVANQTYLFARKFDPEVDPDTIDELDALLLEKRREEARNATTQAAPTQECEQGGLMGAEGRGEGGIPLKGSSENELRATPLGLRSMDEVVI
jgi:hypothetical protein